MKLFHSTLIVPLLVSATSWNFSVSHVLAAPIPRLGSVWLDSVCRVPKEASLRTVASMFARDTCERMLWRSSSGIWNSSAFPTVAIGHCSVFGYTSCWMGEENAKGKMLAAYKAMSDFDHILSAMISIPTEPFLFLDQFTFIYTARRHSPPLFMTAVTKRYLHFAIPDHQLVIQR
jgi:hypothetical protein